MALNTGMPKRWDDVNAQLKLYHTRKTGKQEGSQLEKCRGSLGVGSSPEKGVGVRNDHNVLCIYMEVSKAKLRKEPKKT